jgi:hypothetical protein
LEAVFGRAKTFGNCFKHGGHKQMVLMEFSSEEHPLPWGGSTVSCGRL